MLSLRIPFIYVSRINYHIFENVFVCHSMLLVDRTFKAEDTYNENDCTLTMYDRHMFFMSS